MNSRGSVDEELGGVFGNFQQYAGWGGEQFVLRQTTYGTEMDTSKIGFGALS